MPEELSISTKFPEEQINSSVEFEMISLADPIVISATNFIIEGSILSTTGTHYKTKPEECISDDDKPPPAEEITETSPDKKSIIFLIKKFLLNQFRKRRSYREGIEPE